MAWGSTSPHGAYGRMRHRNVEVSRQETAGAPSKLSGGAGRPAPTPRSTALPDHFPYADTGCEYLPRCLSCPLPSCYLDHGNGVQTVIAQLREAALVSALATGASLPQAASVAGIATRTAQRTIARVRRRGYLLAPVDRGSLDLLLAQLAAHPGKRRRVHRLGHMR